MPFEAQKVREWTDDAHNGNGCILGEKLSLLSVTDRVKALQQIDNQAKQDAVTAKKNNPAYLELSSKYAHMQLYASKPRDWGWTSIYHEDYKISSNSSAVTCSDVHYEQQNRAATTKQYNLQY